MTAEVEPLAGNRTVCIAGFFFACVSDTAGPQCSWETLFLLQNLSMGMKNAHGNSSAWEDLSNVAKSDVRGSRDHHPRCVFLFASVSLCGDLENSAGVRLSAVQVYIQAPPPPKLFHQETAGRTEVRAVSARRAATPADCRPSPSRTEAGGGFWAFKRQLWVTLAERASQHQQPASPAPPRFVKCTRA